MLVPIYNMEHGIHQDGQLQTQANDNTLLNFYRETESGKYIPRTLMIDTDPTTINKFKTSHHSTFYDDQYLISGKEDAGNNYARGYYQIGRELIKENEIMGKLRKLIETFDNLDEFIFNHSVGGGTGSGLTALLVEKISNNYPKKCRTTFSILCASFKIKLYG